MSAKASDATESNASYDAALAKLRHDHVFDAGNPQAERGARAVMWITAVMMVLEIAAGWWFNSMALLADGWHMSSHVLAIGLSAFAYASARKYSTDPRFAFGSWKIEVLAAYTSAVFLLSIAALMAITSVERLLSPQTIHYREAIIVAVIGLAINVLCALILGNAHGDDHTHGHSHAHEHGETDTHTHHDLNLRSAYVHVIADAATSVLAIVALVGGWIYGWSWLDPVMGIVGAILVAVWAKNLMRSSGTVLLDREMDAPVVEEIRTAIAAASDRSKTTLVDLHVWRVGKTSYACLCSILSSDPTMTADRIRTELAVHEEIVHATIEINYLPSNPN